MSVRVAIVGAGGGVGSSVAFNLLRSAVPYAVELVDGRSGMAVSHGMDLQQVVAAGATGTVRVVDLGAIADADVVVVSAAVPLTVNTSRLVYLRDNAEILASVVAAIPEPPTWPGVLLVVTNPVDALVTWLVRTYGFARRQVVGYTLNDTLRLRTAIGDTLDARPGDVDAWVLGEHGDRCVPLLDRVRVGGTSVTLTAEQRARADEFVRTWYVRHVALDSGRSSTWTSGLGIASMVDAMIEPAAEPWPVAVTLDGEYGVHDVAITVPATLGPGGVEHVLEWELSPAQQAALTEAATAVGAAADATTRRPSPGRPPGS